MVPRVAARKAHQRLWEFSFATPKRLLQQYLPTPDILGATVVASGRGASRVVAAYLPPTEPRGRSVTLTCFIRWPAGVKLPTPGPVFSLRL